MVVTGTLRFCVESNGCYAKVKALYEKILVVDDDPNVSTVFGEIAGLTGYRSVEKAANGLEALGKYEVSKPDLVLMDLDMPIMDGYRACREIRRADPDAKIIVITGDLRSTLARRTIKEGLANTFLQKPVNTSSLVKIIKKVTTSAETLERSNH
jgi:two-component system chemotaxis response regulator CheY